MTSVKKSLKQENDFGFIKKEPLDEDSIEQNEDPQKVENTTDYFSTSKGPMIKLEGLYL